jgi:hypothetical protein
MLVIELARGRRILRRENVSAFGRSDAGETHVSLLDVPPARETPRSPS